MWQAKWKQNLRATLAVNSARGPLDKKKKGGRVDSGDGAGSGVGGGGRLTVGWGWEGDATTAEELTSSALVVVGAGPTKRVHAVICRCAAE